MIKDCPQPGPVRRAHFAVDNPDLTHGYVGVVLEDIPVGAPSLGRRQKNVSSGFSESGKRAGAGQQLSISDRVEQERQMRQRRMWR